MQDLFKFFFRRKINILQPVIYKWIIGDWNNDGFKKYFNNTGWLFVARGATFVTSFLTIAIVARYLGPENLGKLSYAQSFVAILSIFASLGIDQILYRDLSSYPEKEKEFLGTAIMSKFIFGIIAFSLAILISLLLHNEPLLTLLIGITAFTFLINPLGTIGILFQSRVQAKYSSQITIFLAFFIPALKLLVIFFDKGIIFFSLLLIIEATINTIWSLYIYINKLKQNPSDWRFRSPVFKQLMSDSWPFLLAGLFGYIYSRIDQIMLQHYLGSRSVGLYDVAVKLSNIWSFIPALIISSIFPALVNARKIDRLIYLKRYKSLTILITIITFVVTIFVFFTAKPLISLLFGTQFLESVLILKIYIWSGAIAIIGILVQQYLITENKGWIHLVMTLIGAVLNIALNLILIPRYGMTGAAVATLFSYSVIPLGLFFFQQFRKDLQLLRTKQISN